MFKFKLLENAVRIIAVYGEGYNELVGEPWTVEECKDNFKGWIKMNDEHGRPTCFDLKGRFDNGFEEYMVWDDKNDVEGQKRIKEAIKGLEDNEWIGVQVDDYVRVGICVK